MQRIFLFLYRIRAFLLFVLLEAIAISLIVSNNTQQGSAFFNSSNELSGSVFQTQSNIVDYFSLSSVNKSLMEKNAQLLSELEALRKPADSIFIPLDTAMYATMQFKGAKVINNSLRLSQNHLTINKGSNHGVRTGMGVINEQGVVGRVKSVSRNFSTIISLLHTELLVSSKIQTNDVFGSTKWDGLNPQQAKLMYVPRHVVVEIGDQVVTSGYNSIFPEGIPIGTVIEVKPGTDTNYLDITLKLDTDFSKISYVYLVESFQQKELDSLYQSTGISNE
ncbi:rod shape-determining protein MreC [Aquiflexum gelatinilyticum]|jgi:rod shape-determining protein MreC|uniref:Cell shape-determining protein MreC n=1 Tax=Aquiflexum gelatinilyticum TaxID=2961943 RepID=A0A9X2P3H5_9BACT|nr:rod shape-determining protein MreC [Aquiflexum gelatinilyticum]MCR9015128.1 rod shape-determining protein MreC [Aquiflexum gelatinilyticum]